MDAVTAVSGSGPAYVFLLAEELARAGVAAGLPEALATRLARETVAGSGELLHRSELASATLRQNVTSPGGTTAAALDVLMGEADCNSSWSTRSQQRRRGQRNWRSSSLSRSACRVAQSAACHRPKFGQDRKMVGTLALCPP